MSLIYQNFMLEVIEVFIENLLSRVSGVISICFIGSRNTQEGVAEESDLDLMVLIDDTEEVAPDVKNVIKNIARMVNPILHCQIYTLTEFWKYVNEGSPITYTMLRDATAYYDTGFFETLQKLVKIGSIRPTNKAIEKQLTLAKQLMKITYHSVNKGLIHNLEGAVVSSAQSILMELGVAPPSPKQVPAYVKKFLVDEGLLPEEYYHIANKVVQTHKDIEHEKKTSLSGKELQDLYNDTNKFVTRMEQVLVAIKGERKD